MSWTGSISTPSATPMATWMRRYGGLDTKDLIDTGRWKSEQSAARYAHAVTGEAARKAALLPTPTGYRMDTAWWKTRGKRPQNPNN